jgi:hypothetical protein
MALLRGTMVRIGIYGLQKRDYQNIGRVAIKAAGDWWHARYKNSHFQLFAFGRYGYRKRTAAWEAKKAAEHPEAGGRPLVFTGNSERDAMSASEVRATATAHDRYHAEVVIAGPTLNFHADEMTRVIGSEIRTMENAFALGWAGEFTRAARRNGHTIPLEKVA